MPDREWPIRRFRPSSVERMPYLEALTRAHVEGRLDETVYQERVDAAATATSFDALDALVADVPFDAAEKAAELAERRIRRANRRQVLLGAAGFAGVGAASFALARLLRGSDSSQERAEADAAPDPSDGASAGSGPETEPTGIATTMFQYSGFTATAVGELIDNATGLGLRKIDNATLRADWARVEGLDSEGRPVIIGYRQDSAPQVEEATGTSGPYLRPAQVRDLDLADLLARTRKEIAVNEADAYVLVRSVDGGEIAFHGGLGGRATWDLTGTRLVSVWE